MVEEMISTLSQDIRISIAEDTSVPRNVRSNVVTGLETYLMNTKDDLDLRVYSTISVLEEQINDTNIPQHARTQSSVNRDQILSVILALTFFGVLISWSPVSAEEVTGQEQDVSLYLYSQNGVGKLHTKETGGHGDSETVQIQPGSSVFFALNNSLQADLPVKSYRSNIGFHIYLYASSTDCNAGHLKIL